MLNYARSTTERDAIWVLDSRGLHPGGTSDSKERSEALFGAGGGKRNQTVCSLLSLVSMLLGVLCCCIVFWTLTQTFGLEFASSGVGPGWGSDKANSGSGSKL